MGKGYPRDWNRRRRKVYRRDNYTCRKCGKRGGRFGSAELHAHHKVPKGRGGSHRLKNLHTLCKDCHHKVHGGSGGSSGIPQRGFWGSMHQMAAAEKNERFGGCPSCRALSLTVRWERLSFLNKVKVIQCSSCGAKYDERIIEEDGIRYLKLVRVSSYRQIQPATSATNQELERMAVRAEMDERAARRAAQDTFGCCPNCGEDEAIAITETILGTRFKCETCRAKLKPKWLSKSRWKMIRGDRELKGKTLDLLEWEQYAVEQLDRGERETSETEEAVDFEPPEPLTHHIPRDTWRGRVATVLDGGDWMTAQDVSKAVSKTERKLSTSGASSVLSDMARHDDVVRRRLYGGRFKYEYRLRPDAEIA